MIGKGAVMHVYSYAPKTLEITSVTSHLFKDVDARERAVSSDLFAYLNEPRPSPVRCSPPLQ